MAALPAAILLGRNGRGLLQEKSVKGLRISAEISISRK